MRISVRRGLAAVLVLATLTPVSACSAAPSWDSTSDAKVYLVDNTTATQIKAGTTLDWNYGNGVVLSAVPVPTVPTDQGASLVFPAPPKGSTDYVAFISPMGSERTKSSWKEWGDSSTIGSGALVPAVWPAYLGNGDAAGVKRSGGRYSMGIAYLKDDHQTVAKAFYTTISVTAGSGTWKFATP